MVGFPVFVSIRAPTSSATFFLPMAFSIAATLSSSVLVIEYQTARLRENTSIDSLRAALAESEKAESNLLTAIESGAATPALIARYQQRSDESTALRARIAAAESAISSIYPREVIIEALKLFRSGDLTDPVFRSALLEAFLVSATFYPSAPQEASIPCDGPCVRLLLNLPTEKSTTEDGGASEPGEGSYKEIWWR